MVVADNFWQRSEMLEHFQTWATLAAAIAAWIALAGVIFLWKATESARRQLRLQSAPFIRVDLGLTDAPAADDFQPPDPYYVRDEPVDIAPDLPDKEKVTIALWASNLQRAPLGVALEVDIGIAFVPGDAGQPEEHVETRIAYLGFRRAVQVNVLRVPRAWEFGAYVTFILYRDLYDEWHRHFEVSSGSSATFGRFDCEYDGASYVSWPRAWLKGRGVALAEEVLDYGDSSEEAHNR